MKWNYIPRTFCKLLKQLAIKSHSFTLDCSSEHVVHVQKICNFCKINSNGRSEKMANLI